MIACYKWRWLAAFQIHFILLSKIFMCFVPTEESRGLHPFIHCVNALVIFITHYCGSVWNIYSITIVACFEMSFGVHITYDRPFGLKEILITILYTSVIFGIIAAFSVAFDTVS